MIKALSSSSLKETEYIYKKLNIFKNILHALKYIYLGSIATNYIIIYYNWSRHASYEIFGQIIG